MAAAWFLRKSYGEVVMVKRYAIRKVENDQRLADDLLRRATDYTNNWTEEHGFVYAFGSGKHNPGFVERCPRCGALVLVPHTRDVMKNLADVYAHVAWHDDVENEDEKLGVYKDKGPYKPPGVYCEG